MSTLPRTKGGMFFAFAMAIKQGRLVFADEDESDIFIDNVLTPVVDFAVTLPYDDHWPKRVASALSVELIENKRKFHRTQIEMCELQQAVIDVIRRDHATMLDSTKCA